MRAQQLEARIEADRQALVAADGQLELLQERLQMHEVSESGLYFYSTRNLCFSVNCSGFFHVKHFRTCSTSTYQHRTPESEFLGCDDKLDD